MTTHLSTHPPCRWARGLALGLCLVVIAASACDDRPARNPFNPNPNAPSFRIDNPEQYRTHGIYTPFMNKYQTLLVSRPASGSTMLVALDAHCPDDGKIVAYDELTGRLHCPRCNSRWSTDGVIQSGSTCKTSLDRYRIRVARSGSEKQPDLIVDTSRRYRQSVTRQIGDKTVEIQEWSATDSMYHFDIDPRHNNTLSDKIQMR